MAATVGGSALTNGGGNYAWGVEGTCVEQEGWWEQVVG